MEDPDRPIEICQMAGEQFRCVCFKLSFNVGLASHNTVDLPKQDTRRISNSNANAFTVLIYWRKSRRCSVVTARSNNFDRQAARTVDMTRFCHLAVV